MCSPWKGKKLMMPRPYNKYHFDQLKPGLTVTYLFDTTAEARQCYKAAWQWKYNHLGRAEMKITIKGMKVTCVRMA